jgi:hypothetical protein
MLNNLKVDSLGRFLPENWTFPRRSLASPSWWLLSEGSCG